MAILVLSPVASKTSASNRESTVATVRLQTALVRALLDEVDRFVPPEGTPHALSGQLAEEIARLGCRLVDAATEMAAATNETSVFAAAVGAIQCDGVTLRPLEHVEGVRVGWSELDLEEAYPLDDDAFDDDAACSPDPESALRITAAAVVGAERVMHRSA